MTAPRLTSDNLARRESARTWWRTRLILLEPGLWEGVRDVADGRPFDPADDKDRLWQFRYEEGRELALRMRLEGLRFSWRARNRIPPTVKAWLIERCGLDAPAAPGGER